jgi:hypothetical protein
LHGTIGGGVALRQAMATLGLSPPIDRLRRRFRHAPWTALVEVAARAGYAARGVVYLSIGAMALLAALDLWPRAEGALGALEAWGRWPAGIILLWLVGLGLYGFAGWRALQSLFDADRLGRKPRAIVSRLGQAISGVTYAGLAVAVFGLVDALEDLHEADDQAATQEAVAKALEMPLGGLAVVAVGLFVLGAGIGSFVRAFVDHFGRGLDGDRETRAWAGALARFGYAARGVALAPAGVLLVSAGLNARASDARGLEGALNLLHDGPLGEVVLSLTALGLLAFGAFAIVEGWLRRIRAPEP